MIDNLSVEELQKKWGERLEINLVSGKRGLKRNISEDRVQKPGLRMIEPSVELEQGKIQIFGRTEVSYINSLPKPEKKNIIDQITSQDIPCLIISKDLLPNEYLKKTCQKRNVPLFITKLYTGKLILILNEILEERLAPFTTMHGVLLDIHRLGALILGKSGIGKSECALDLIIRGSKLIADDVIEVRKVGSNTLIGNGPDDIKHLMEIRGIGIINIKDLFGRTSVMESREIEMIIELSRWQEKNDYERLGIDQKTYKIMDIDIPYIIIPVSPGRNISTIIEVAVRNQLLKLSGINTLDQFNLPKSLNN
ncbi:MAG: HPr(Ser) kinase/phosphatase [Thermodesulfobacteriota bacterium]